MDIVSLIESGSASLAYLVMAGLVLGSLHGLEPGHSKTMMAAFIIAVRGSVMHAVLLGLSAAFSHSLIVWILAWLALRYGNELIGEELEPYLLIGSSVIIITIGIVMLVRMRPGKPDHDHAHGHSHPHTDHDHARGHSHAHAEHDHPQGHSHTHTEHDHSHEHDIHDDAHARAHAREIEQRFNDGSATLWQTIGFGLTGGLIPCPAAITVLLLCLHIGEFWLGVGMVAAFSAGLALTLVLVGVAAALGLKYARDRFSRIDRFYRIAPFVSGGLIIVIGIYMGASGLVHLQV